MGTHTMVVALDAIEQAKLDAGELVLPEHSDSHSWHIRCDNPAHCTGYSECSRMHICKHGHEVPAGHPDGWMNEADADFVTALHGSLSELIRALIDSHDEVERLDEARDLSQSELAHTLLENMELREEIDELKSQIPSKKEHT